MKYWIPRNWSSSFEQEGLLFFVQRIQEMLFHYSEDIRRAPVHNTSTLTHEYLKLTKEINSGKVKEYYLDKIYDEIKNSLLHDKILNDELGEKFISNLFAQMNAAPKEKQANFVKYLNGIIEINYLRWAESYILKHIAFGNHKNEIEFGARSWISDLVMRGYSREFIYSYIEENLIEGSLSSISDLESFFNRFDFKKRKYRVYMQISKVVLPYTQILNSRLSLSFDDDGNFGVLDNKNKYKTCYFEIESLDYYKAVSYAYSRINIFCKYYCYLSNKKKTLLYKHCCVIDQSDNNMHYLPIIPTGFYSKELSGDAIIIKMMDSVIMGLNENINADRYTIEKAIDLHNSAIRQPIPKDGFVSLWSILEVICPYGEYKSKIDMVISNIVPVLQNDYFPTLFESIYCDLEDNLPKTLFNNLYESINAADILEKTAHFCMLPEYESTREDIFKKLSSFPVIRNKIYNLYILRDNKKALFDLSIKYRHRVEWHLYRLYRTRNSIVHSGTANTDVQVLGEHLHSYVDSVLNELAFKMSQNKTLSSANNVFVDTTLLVHQKQDYFSATGCITNVDIDNLLNQYYLLF